jgi:hypothetical protein
MTLDNCAKEEENAVRIEKLGERERGGEGGREGDKI